MVQLIAIMPRHWVRRSGSAALLAAMAGLALAQGPEPAGEVLPAEFRWAQRKDRILLTIELQVGAGERGAGACRAGASPPPSLR